MNLTRDLRKEPLPIGFYNICGEQGAGKTSLAIALFRTDYKRWRKYRYELACGLAQEYYEVNGIALNIDKTLYLSTPAGAFTSTIWFFLAPIKAVPIGDSFEILF